MYAVHSVEGKPLQRIFYELYRDRAAFDAHEGQPHVRRFLDEREQYLAGGKLTACRCRLARARTGERHRLPGGAGPEDRRRAAGGGLSQPELARMIDRSVAWVSQVERGVRKVDRMSVLETLAAALDVPLAELAAEAPVVAAVNEEPPGAAGLRLVLSGV